jgi:hypothetical protein
MATETLTQRQIAFEIRFALGQAAATHFINAHTKSPEARPSVTGLVRARKKSLAF